MSIRVYWTGPGRATPETRLAKPYMVSLDLLDNTADPPVQLRPVLHHDEADEPVTTLPAFEHLGRRRTAARTASGAASDKLKHLSALRLLSLLPHAPVVPRH